MSKYWYVGGPFMKNFSWKISQCRKKLKGGPFGLARCGMLRGKTGKSFLVQFARPNGAIWCNYILQNFCRTILVSSGGLKKTLTKSHDYSRLF